MNQIATFAEAGAVIMACWAIVSGIGAWKREFIGKRQIELAEQVLAKFFEIKDSIAMIRSPFSSAEEGKTRKRSKHESPDTSQLLDRGYIVFERYSKRETAFAEFSTLKYRFMASFGSGAEAIFNDTTGVLNSIFVPSVLQQNQRHVRERNRMEQANPSIERTFQRLLRTLWTAAHVKGVYSQARPLLTP